MSEHKLISEIVSRSTQQAWPQAKTEWALSEVFRAASAETCLCGHYPILEICVLRNRLNGNQAEVGNCCVRNFMGIASNLIFDGLKRIAKDPDAALNVAAIEHAKSKGWIGQWEEGFLLSTQRKRVLSEKQAIIRRRINAKVSRCFDATGARKPKDR